MAAGKAEAMRPDLHTAGQAAKRQKVGGGGCDDALPQNIGTYLAARVVQEGVTDYFCVPGDFNLVLLDQLLLDKRLRMIKCCNELNAGYAADGYARERGLGLLVVTFTVGGLSAINAVAGAASDDLPLIVVSGAPNSNDFGSERVLHHTVGLSDFSQQIQCYKQICCFSTIIKSAELGASKVNEALTKCLVERKPVYIEICCNIAGTEHHSCGAPLSIADAPLTWPSNPQNLEAAVDAAVEVLSNAAKPVLVAGRGAGKFRAQEAFMAFAEASGYAWASMPDAKGDLPESHPQYMGTYWGCASSPAVRETVESSDICVFVGPCFCHINTAGYSLPIAQQRMIKIREHEVVVCTRGVFCCVSMAEVLEALARRVQRNGSALESYRRMCVSPGLPASLHAPTRKLTTKLLFHHIQSMLTGDMAVLVEAGDSWFNSQMLKLPDGCHYHWQMLFSSIGWSVGATLGLAAALQGKRRVVSLIGDGSFQVSAQEVSTMLLNGLNSIILLINNDGYAMLSELHDDSPLSYKNIKMWDYCGVVEAFNRGESKLYTKRAETEGDLVEAIQAAKERQDSLCFIECVTAKDDVLRQLCEWRASSAEALFRPQLTTGM